MTFVANDQVCARIKKALGEGLPHLGLELLVGRVGEVSEHVVADEKNASLLKPVL